MVAIDLRQECASRRCFSFTLSTSSSTKFDVLNPDWERMTQSYHTYVLNKGIP